jgi:hypothetical protein
VKKFLGLFSFVTAGLFVACLPGDIRPEPASVFVSVEGSEAARNGFVTDDGWTIRFERLLIGMGYVVLTAGDCEVYGAARYSVLFDLTVPGKQKLGDVYGLNTCDLQFHATSAWYYLGNGVTPEDRAFIYDRADVEAHGYRAPVLYMRGNASRGNVAKHFAWRFRRGLALTECENTLGELMNIGLQLKSVDVLRPLVTFHPDELFRDALEPDAKIRFDPLAATDTNGDDEVTLEEISQIPAPLDELTYGELRDAGAPDGGYLTADEYTEPGWPRFMGQKLLARAFRLDGNVCRDNGLRSDMLANTSPYEL